MEEDQYVVVTPWSSAQVGPECVRCVTDEQEVAEAVAEEYPSWAYDHELTVASDVPRAIIYTAPFIEGLEEVSDVDIDAPQDLVDQARQAVMEHEPKEGDQPIDDSGATVEQSQHQEQNVDIDIDN